MMTCIYCCRETTEREAEAHVLPESLCSNDLVLPKGTVCTSCNHYLGKLDAALTLHREIAVCLQALSVPGKGGKPRMKLGWLERVGSRQSRQITIRGVGMKSLEIGERSLSIELRDAPGWDPRKFNRGLHHVAFNFLALASREAVLEERFDPARRYIRGPRRKEVWPYWSASVGNKPEKSFSLRLLDESPGAAILIQMFHHLFLVDLLRSGCASQWLSEKTRGVLDWKAIDHPEITPEEANPADRADGSRKQRGSRRSSA